MIVGLLAMLFVIVSAYIVLARFDRQSLGYVRQNDQTTQIVESVYNLIVGELRGSSGEALRGAAYADTYGYKTASGDRVLGCPWLAASEPVHDVNLPQTESWLPRGYRYPSLSGFGGMVVGLRTIEGLMFHASADNNPPESTINVVPGSGSADTLVNAREPFMDADGDGIADSFFGGVAVLTELANAVAGTAVSGRYPDGVGTSPMDPSRRHPYDPNNAANYLAWQHFNELARYIVAAKVISHGGMVQVSAATKAQAWNSQFLAGMFNWVRYPNDPAQQPDYNELLAMWNERFTVEPVLRRRGGLLAGYDADAPTGVPPALWALQQRFRNTFKPYYHPNFKIDDWQRFNLADLNEWEVWRRAVALDASDYDAWYNGGQGMGGPDWRRSYVPRQLLTTVNNSDELARLRSPGVGVSTLGLPAAGKTKFYLGRLARAFDAQGQYYPNAGEPLIRELAQYYYEMLADYVEPDGSWADPNQHVPPREQAYMLAVNTVAFAAPRLTAAGHEGKIDAVYCTDPLNSQRQWIGHAPQPYITQVLAYNKVSGDPPSSNDIALAIELYLPDDPAPDGWDGTGLWDPDDEFALNLEQFAIKLNGRDPQVLSNFKVLSAIPNVGQRMSGRRFLAFTINDQGGNTELDDAPLVQGRIINDMMVDIAGAGGVADPKRIEVELWRINVDGTLYYMVDRFTLELEDTSNSYPGDLVEWVADAYRDTSYVPYLGAGPANDRPARWRMVGDLSVNPPPYTDPLQMQLPNRKLTIGKATVWIGGSSGQELEPTQFAPTVPLYLMNAGAYGGGPIHGDYRPASFPTVGFLLFVPRFAHERYFDGVAWALTPMTETLREHWEKASYTLEIVPADFGHMPVFDNKQQVAGSSDFEKTGSLPWGLLVFDYFTTLNPSGWDGVAGTADDIDPYKVPGRININVAPWYVLAGLPVIGPTNGALDGSLPMAPTAAPAFWARESGVLAGVGALGTPRFIGHRDGRLLRPQTWGGGWWRLGPDLAQAAAAYRDRVQYVDISFAPLVLAQACFRNAGGMYREPNRYGGIRGAGDDLLTGDSRTWKRGFLTLGELANVAGFDSSLNAELGGDPAFTALGQGDFIRGVSLLALLDTHYLTTRSNTFTVYASLTDRTNPQASVRTQVTIDRSNLLPRLIERDTNNDGVPDQFTVVENTGMPETIGRREVSYFNARYDD